MRYSRLHRKVAAEDLYARSSKCSVGQYGNSVPAAIEVHRVARRHENSLYENSTDPRNCYTGPTSTFNSLNDYVLLLQI